MDNLNDIISDRIVAYQQNFSSDSLGSWTVVDGDAGLSALLLSEENYALKIAAKENQNTIIVADDSPNLRDGEYEAVVKFSGDATRIGLIFRYIDNNNWSAVQYDINGNWTWHNVTDGNQANGKIVTSIELQPDIFFTIKIEYVGSNIKIYLNNKKIYSSVIPAISARSGKIGFRAWYTEKTVYLSNIRCFAQKAPPPKIFEEQFIESEAMKVILDNTFPRVICYEMKDRGETISGQKSYIHAVVINDVTYWPDKVTFNKFGINEKAAVYILEFSNLQIKMVIHFKVQGNMLNMNITGIEENGGYKVRTIEFLDHKLVSMENTLPNAAQASAWTDGGFNKIWEEFYNLNDIDIPKGERRRTYAIINGGNYAATIINNVIDGTAKVILSNDGSRSAIWNGTWIYREMDSETEELPWSKVVICGDENGDGLVDWQDGAIGYRKNMVIPFGGEDIKNNMSYISYNIGSLAQIPFLRALDNAKKLYCYTDGFGQMILCKGYQGEGHDDSHPDYGGHIGIRQGGIKDFNTLIECGREYNLKIGAHINATEFHADAFEVNDAALVKPYKPGWNWLDQAYLVDKYKDITTGELYRRLDMLKCDAPGLSWVYVDAYSGAGWEAYKLYHKLNKNRWLTGTEYSGPMEQGVAWVHWGTDPYYPAKGNNSRIMRFIRNHVQDTFPSSELLKGNKLLGVGGWYTHHSILEGVEVFYNQILPTKYMQYFPIIKWTDNRIDFEGNVYTEKINGKVKMYKNGRGIAIMQDKLEISESLIFIPWDPVNEDKIYHWNPLGGETVWDLPASWLSSKVKLYMLTGTGKNFVTDITVSEGRKIIMNAEAKTPYILFKGDADVPKDKEMIWGQGGYVKDPGFDSRSFDIWERESTWHDTSHIMIMEEKASDIRKGNTYLNIGGNNGADAIVSQKIIGLVPGKTYTASVWVKTLAGRKASIGVRNYGGSEVKNWVCRTDVIQYGEANKYSKDYYQHLRVVFDVPGCSGNNEYVANPEFVEKPEYTASALLYLEVEKGNAVSSVQFDDVRIWENPGKTPVPVNSVLFEDFENVDEGLGPFVMSREYGARVHIAHKREGSNQLKDFVINGEYSLKLNIDEKMKGEILRTQQSTLKLKPNTKYQLSFSYRYDKNLHESLIPNQMYSISVKTDDGGSENNKLDVTLNSNLNLYNGTFTTGGYEDYYLAINKIRIGQVILVIDDILIIEVVEP